MILTRAPLRISFVGGGTDSSDFYQKHAGRVISATINKYVYVLLNPTPLINKFTVKYQKTEFVNHPKDLEHTRIRAALMDLNIHNLCNGLEIGTFADLPAKTGLGSSSTFSVALIKALNFYLGNNLSRVEIAEAACRLEIDLLKEPIGKQDQYAASFGGFNIFNFNPDHTVRVEPILINNKVKSELEKNILVFYTGITRNASSVLTEQRANSQNKIDTLKKMADSVDSFVDLLQKGDYAAMGSMLHESWLLKKSLASTISNGLIDGLYEAGMKSGALGGKILGAGGGGCLLFFVPPEKQEFLRISLANKASDLKLSDFKELPIKFVESGCEVVLNGMNHLV